VLSDVGAINAAAPIRICDNGGWTDTRVARYGKVFNIAVRPLVHVRIERFATGTRDARVVVTAENYGVRYLPPLEGPWGPHPLIEAAIRAIPPPDTVDIEITIRSKAPAGASTGTSAAVLVALLGALDRIAGGERPRADIAKLAHVVETRWLGRQSGVQDQLCSACGGLNFIEIPEYPDAVVTPLPRDTAFTGELGRRLALVYLGRGHSSSEVHETVVRSLQRSGPESAPLKSLRAAAEEARDAILARDFVGLGVSMRRNTEAQAALHDALVHPDAWRVIDIAAAHGALGWKVNGAGGDGGSLSLLGDGRRSAKKAMLQAIAQENPAFGAIPIAISRRGLRIW
jgi:D-glycero-alpha-D-manno-heptose-7-phosphate kinase